MLQMAFTFNSQEDIDNWTVTTDKMNRQALSHAKFELGPYKTGIFRGFIDSTPKHGDYLTTYGYCNIQSRTRFVRKICIKTVHL